MAKFGDKIPLDTTSSQTLKRLQFEQFLNRGDQREPISLRTFAHKFNQDHSSLSPRHAVIMILLLLFI